MRVTIIGSGLIGRCWAVLFARAGHSVVLHDSVPAQLEAALAGMGDQLAALHLQGLLNGQTVAEVLARISTASDLKAALSEAQYVQECIPEDLQLKIDVFARISPLVGPDTIMASSTSCIVPSKFTAGLKNRENCIVAHPINPPHYIPLVELVPSPWTSPAVVESVRALMKAIGQAPVVVKKEVNGFIINRLQYALLMEAWRLVEDDVASPEDVDTAVSQGLGLRWSFMGPFQTIDLNANGVQDYCERYGENITAICKEQADARALKGSATAARIDAAMRQSVPLSSLPERRAWRDRHLAALAVHKAHAD